MIAARERGIQQVFSFNEEEAAFVAVALALQPRRFLDYGVSGAGNAFWLHRPGFRT